MGFSKLESVFDVVMLYLLAKPVLVYVAVCRKFVPICLKSFAISYDTCRYNNFTRR